MDAFTWEELAENEKNPKKIQDNVFVVKIDFDRAGTGTFLMRGDFDEHEAMRQLKKAGYTYILSVKEVKFDENGIEKR